MILAAWEEILQWLPVCLTQHIRRPGLSVLGWYNQRFRLPPSYCNGPIRHHDQKLPRILQEMGTLNRLTACNRQLSARTGI